MAREKRLADEHLLLDPVNLRAKLVYCGWAGWRKALMFEEKVGEGTALKVLVPEVKDELVVLSRLTTDYEIVMENVGLLGPKPGMTPSHHIEVRVPAPHVDASMARCMGKSLSHFLTTSTGWEQQQSNCSLTLLPASGDFGEQF